MPFVDGQPLRILHATRAPVGGIFRHILDLANGQADRGHHVGIIADSLTGGERAEQALAEIAPRLKLGVHRTAIRREPLPPRSDLGRLVIVGVVWFGVYNLALNAAEQRIDAGTAAMLVNVGPVMIAVAAGFLLGEGFPRTLIVGCGVAFAGAVVIGAATRGQSADAGVGALLCLLAGARWF